MISVNDAPMTMDEIHAELNGLEGSWRVINSDRYGKGLFQIRDDATSPWVNVGIAYEQDVREVEHDLETEIYYGV